MKDEPKPAIWFERGKCWRLEDDEGTVYALVHRRTEIHKPDEGPWQVVVTNAPRGPEWDDLSEVFIAPEEAVESKLVASGPYYFEPDPNEFANADAAMCVAYSSASNLWRAYVKILDRDANAARAILKRL